MAAGRTWNAPRESGAQGRNRTTDTAIFSRMLYQLSYLGAEPRRRLTGRLYRRWAAACPAFFGSNPSPPCTAAWPLIKTNGDGAGILVGQQQAHQLRLPPGTGLAEDAVEMRMCRSDGDAAASGCGLATVSLADLQSQGGFGRREAEAFAQTGGRLPLILMRPVSDRGPFQPPLNLERSYEMRRKGCKESLGVRLEGSVPPGVNCTP